MKIIFLDIDGVLCTYESFKLGRRVHACDPKNTYHQPLPRCVEALNRIIATTNAKIVLSSTWRMFGAGVMKSILKDWMVFDCMIGITPRERALGYRGDEINEWIKANPETEQFVILDDDCDMANLIDHLVWVNCDSGLTEQDAEKAIEILSREKHNAN